jgi:hypothetical protein
VKSLCPKKVAQRGSKSITILKIYSYPLPKISLSIINWLARNIDVCVCNASQSTHVPSGCYRHYGYNLLKNIMNTQTDKYVKTGWVMCKIIFSHPIIIVRGVKISDGNRKYFQLICT